MADIFISFKHEDRAKVAPIVLALEDSGWSVWWDTRIGAGETWDEVIERELAAASCVVVVWSLLAAQSRWVRSEALTGLEREILVPVRIDDVSLPLAFKLTQTIDLSTWDGGPADFPYKQLVEAIERVVKTPKHLSLAGPSRSDVVVLVHGSWNDVRWREEIGATLSSRFAVESINYSWIDVLRFLIPSKFLRSTVIDSIYKQIRNIRKQYPNSRISFICHSFGAYVIANILLRNFDFTAKRIIFCGSVVKHSFPFEQVLERFSPPLLNEVGSTDVWPAVAKSITWGYGSTGMVGFRRPRVHDRWHIKARRGYFLNREFCEKYWIPYLKAGTIIDGGSTSSSPPLWAKLLGIIQLKYAALLFLMLSILVLRFQYYDQVTQLIYGCYPYDPLTDHMDVTKGRRECLSNRITVTIR